MRMKRKQNTFTPRVLSGALIIIVVVFLGSFLWKAVSLLGSAGESVAMLSAAMQLPDGSVALLRERFRAEIYNPEAEDGIQELEPKGEPLPEQYLPVEPEDLPEDDVTDDSDPDVTTPAQNKWPSRIPAEYSAPIIGEQFKSKAGGNIVSYGKGLIRNETSLASDSVQEILDTPYPIVFEDTDEPQVLLVHTHATESFEKYDSAVYDTRNTWRSTDNKNNMVSVGDAFAMVLEQNGIGVIHDTTQHDYPSYNGSYERSAVTIADYLEEYPSIKVVLDLHRDAMQRDDAIVKPVAIVNGEKAAQIMIISACDNEGSLGVPEWKENFRFAAQLQDKMEQMAPGITRPVYLCYRKYNMNLTTGSLLLEFGSNANTLEEAIGSATVAGQALSDMIWENIAENTQSED